jgi:methylthioribose-1-phosphate isomerase
MTGQPGSQGWFTVRWSDDGVVLLDQRRLPSEEVYLTLATVEEVARAIENLAVRGAPAIGCTAAFGIALAAVEADARDPDALREALEAAFERLARTRPTAVNLFASLRRMREVLTAIGRAGVELIPRGARVLTHCNAGALATGGYGTALGIVRAAAAAGREVSVLADETRPFLQGARLTAWELHRDGIPVTVITDGMAGHLMRRKEVDLVLVGADRVAANGDVANKIGTYTLAVLARQHGIPFFVAAPRSTIDLETPSGDAIPIEERGRDEVATLAGVALLPDGVPVRHPAFDVTPAEFVTGIVTERGIALPPFGKSLARLVQEM